MDWFLATGFVQVEPYDMWYCDELNGYRLFLEKSNAVDAWSCHVMKKVGYNYDTILTVFRDNYEDAARCAMSELKNRLSKEMSKAVEELAESIKAIDKKLSRTPEHFNADDVQ